MAATITVAASYTTQWGTTVVGRRSPLTLLLEVVFQQ